MMGERCYVYVACASREDRPISKIGISENPIKRLAAHKRNSSVPYDLVVVQCFDFFKETNARRVERLVIQEMRSLGLANTDRNEFFEIRASDLCEAVREVAIRESFACDEDVPCDLEALVLCADNFGIVPPAYLKFASQEAQALYWQGVRDTLRTLSHLDGLTIAQADFLRIWRHVSPLSSEHPLLEGIILDHFRNHHCSDIRSIGGRASLQFKQMQRDGSRRLDPDIETLDWRSRRNDASS